MALSMVRKTAILFNEAIPTMHSRQAVAIATPAIIGSFRRIIRVFHLKHRSASRVMGNFSGVESLARRRWFIESVPE
jgi:hypothetical protein